jgi:hypothetical protein
MRIFPRGGIDISYLAFALSMPRKSINRTAARRLLFNEEPDIYLVFLVSHVERDQFHPVAVYAGYRNGILSLDFIAKRVAFAPWTVIYNPPSHIVWGPERLVHARFFDDFEDADRYEVRVETFRTEGNFDIRTILGEGWKN